MHAHRLSRSRREIGGPCGTAEALTAGNSSARAQDSKGSPFCCCAGHLLFSGALKACGRWSRLRSAARRSPLAALSPLLVPAGRIPWHRPSGSPSGSTHYPRQALRPDPTDPSEARRPCIHVPAADCLQCAGYIFIIASPRQGRYFNYPSPTACPPLAVLTPSAPAAWSVCDGRS